MILRRVANRLTPLVQPLRPIHGLREAARDESLPRLPIEGEIVAISAGGQDHLARAAPPEITVDEHRRLRGIPIVRVVWRGLVVPGHLAGIDVDRNDGARVEIVARPAGPVRVCRSRIAGPKDVEACFRIVDARQPWMASAVPGGIEALPRLEPGIAGSHRHRVERPLEVSTLRIERLQEPRRIEIVARADDHMIAHSDRRRGEKVLLSEAGNLLVPPFRASARVDRYEVVVRRDEEQIVAPHRRAAVADVRTAFRLPEIAPQCMAIVGVERPNVVRRGHVEDAVYREHGALHGRGAGHDDFTRTLTAGYDRGPCCPVGTARCPVAPACVRSGSQARRPGQRDPRNVRLVDLRERAVAATSVIARVRSPLVAERSEELRRIQSRRRGGRQDDHRQGRGGEITAPSGKRSKANGFHFNVTRNAVTSWMSASVYMRRRSLWGCSGSLTWTEGLALLPGNSLNDRC